MQRLLTGSTNLMPGTRSGRKKPPDDRRRKRHLGTTYLYHYAPNSASAQARIRHSCGRNPESKQQVRSQNPDAPLSCRLRPAFLDRTSAMVFRDDDHSGAADSPCSHQIASFTLSTHSCSGAPEPSWSSCHCTPMLSLQSIAWVSNAIRVPPYGTYVPAPRRHYEGLRRQEGSLISLHDVITSARAPGFRRAAAEPVRAGGTGTPSLSPGRRR